MVAERKEALRNFFKAGQEAYLDEVDIGIGTDRVIAIGPGAMLRWVHGRYFFGEVFRKLVDTFLGKRGFTRTTLHWLGYIYPDSPYPISATVASLDATTDTFTTLLNYYPRTKRFDFVCHSLMGLAAVYWASHKLPALINSEESWDKTIRIITINSPLVGSSLYQQTFEELSQESSFFGMDSPPPLLEDLRPDSTVMHQVSLLDPTKLPGLSLYTIRTKDDPIVPEREAQCKCNESYLAESLETNRYGAHIDALLDPTVIGKVLEFLNK